MDKKRTFHHSKVDEEEEKGVKAETEEQELDEEKDPLDDVDEPEESELAETPEEIDEAPLRAKPAEVESEDSDTLTPGPKINFDYPTEEEDELRPSHPESLQDLANEVSEPDEEGIPQVQSTRQVPSPFQRQHFSEPTSSPRSQNPLSNYGQSNFQLRKEGNYKSNKSSKLYFLILLIIGLVVLGGAVYLLKNQLKLSTPAPSPTPQIAISTPAPTSTPAPLDRSKFKIRVLNGTGKTGLASSVADALKALGYQIDKTGNATASATQTVVRIKPDKQALADQLIKDLADQSASSSSAALKASDTADAEVILGTK